MRNRFAKVEESIIYLPAHHQLLGAGDRLGLRVGEVANNSLSFNLGLFSRCKSEIGRSRQLGRRMER